MTILIARNKEDLKDFEGIKKFEITNIKAPDISEVYNLGQEIEDQELRALFYFIYLTSGRISEVLQVSKSDIRDINKNGHHFKEITLINLKNKKKHTKITVIPIDNEYEQKMWAEIQQFVDHSFDNQPLFPNYRNRTEVWNLLSKYSFKNLKVLNPVTKKFYLFDVKVHPHLLRHFRLTHLVTLYNVNINSLQEIAGWSSTNVASIYIALSGEDLINQFNLKT